MAYTIRNRTLYVSLKNFRHYVLDAKLFETENKDIAYEIWQMVGGAYGDFEVVLEK